MKLLRISALAFLLSVPALYAAYSPEVHLPKEKQTAARKGTMALKSLPRAVRQAYIAEKLGLCYLPNGGYAYQKEATSGTVEGVAASYYYAYTAAVFVGSDGRVYGLRETQKKKDARPQDDELVKRAQRAIYECSPESVFAGLSDEITQMCLKTAKNRLDALPQPVRDCFFAELDGLFYMPDGKSACSSFKGKYRANGTDVMIEFPEVYKGARFVDSNGVEQDYYDVLDNQRKSREVYGNAWTLAALCAELVGKEEVLRLYADEIKLMRKYRKDIDDHGAPKVDKKQQAAATQPKKPEVVRGVNALRSLPRQMREAYLAERMGLCFMSNGEPAYDDKWCISTREGLRVRHYSPKSGAHFIASNGKEYGLHESYDKKATNKQMLERLKKQATETVRGLFGADGDAILDACSKEIAEMAALTAKNRLSMMPAELRMAFLAEHLELMYLPGGKNAYTAGLGKWKVLGCGREAEWKRIDKQSRYMDASGKENIADQIISKYWAKYGSSWTLCKWCTILAGTKPLTEFFGSEVDAMRKYREEVTVE